MKPIEERLSLLEENMASILTMMPMLEKIKASAAAPVANVAPLDLDSERGDPVIRRDPSEKYWKGESFVGRRLSDCTSDYLLAFAKYKDACAYMNQKEANPDKAKYIEYDRADAARARGWAERIKNGHKSIGVRAVEVAPAAESEAYNDEENLPF